MIEDEKTAAYVESILCNQKNALSWFPDEKTGKHYPIKVINPYFLEEDLKAYYRSLHFKDATK